MDGNDVVGGLGSKHVGVDFVLVSILQGSIVVVVVARNSVGVLSLFTVLEIGVVDLFLPRHTCGHEFNFAVQASCIAVTVNRLLSRTSLGNPVSKLVSLTLSQLPSSVSVLTLFFPTLQLLLITLLCLAPSLSPSNLLS